MKFLNKEKISKVFEKNIPHPCHGYLDFSNCELFFPLKYTQYSDEDCVKWFQLCEKLFPNKYLGIKKIEDDSFHIVKLEMNNYFSSRNFLAAISVLRLVQYEYRNGMTKIPETTCKLMELGLPFYKALHFAHYENEETCYGHSVKSYIHNYGFLEESQIGPLVNKNTVSGYFVNNLKIIKSIPKFGLNEIFSISKDFLDKVKDA